MRIRFWIYLALAAGLFLSNGAARPVRAEVAAAAPVKIMPLGDSITSSVENQASYRYWLDHALHTNNISFDFVGSRTLNWVWPPKYSDFDPDNEGWSGYTTHDILFPPSGSGNPGIEKLAATYKPHIVLLHLGTNDVGQGRFVEDGMADLGTIIDKLRAADAHVIILLAKIIPCLPPASNCDKIPAWNTATASLATLKNTFLSPVVLVDQYTGFNATPGVDTVDGTHPNESGEQKMSAKWLAAIQAWYQYVPKAVYIPALRASP